MEPANGHGEKAWTAIANNDTVLTWDTGWRVPPVARAILTVWREPLFALAAYTSISKKKKNHRIWAVTSPFRTYFLPTAGFSTIVNEPQNC